MEDSNWKGFVLVLYCIVLDCTLTDTLVIMLRNENDVVVVMFRVQNAGLVEIWT